MASDFTRSGALVFAAVVLGNIFNFAYLLLLGRVLSVLNYGIVMSLVSAVLLVNGAGSIAQTVTAKLAADLRAANDVERMAAFSSAIARLSLWVAIGASVLAFACQNLVASYLHLEHPELVGVAGLIAGVGFMILFQRGCLQGFGDFKGYTISSSLDFVRMLLVVPLSQTLGAIGSLLAMLAAIVVSAMYGAVTLLRRFGRTQAAAARLDIRRMLYTAGATGSSSFGIAFLMFYDVVLARHFLNPIEAGLYGAAALAGRVLFTTISFLPTILLPHITIRSARGSPIQAILFASVIVTVLVIGPFALIALFVPQLVIRILAGIHFMAGWPLVLPYVLAAGGLALANVLSTYAVGRHRFSFVPFLWLIAAGELTLVSVRHGSSMEFVQDILIGHGAVCCMMIVWTIRELIETRAALPVVEA